MEKEKDQTLWGPEFEFKTVSDLCQELKVTRQAVWQAIKENRIPSPLKLGPRTRVWPPQVFAAILDQWKSGLQDRETQRKLKLALRLKRAIKKLEAQAERSRQRLADLGMDFDSLPEPEAQEACS
jgi:predicted DNA-binding transcriptional regulator AlpA